MATMTQHTTTGATRIVLGALVVFFSAGYSGPMPGLSAQELFEVTSNARVRMTVPAMGLTKAVGLVHEVTPEGLVVQFDAEPGPVTVPGGRIANVEVGGGTTGHPFIGMAIGALVGGAAGTAFRTTHAAKTVEKCPFSFSISFLYTPPPCTTRRIPARSTGKGTWGAALGAVVGLIVGNRIQTDVWYHADMNGPGLSIQPVADLERQGFVLRLSF